MQHTKYFLRLSLICFAKELSSARVTALRSPGEECKDADGERDKAACLCNTVNNKRLKAEEVVVECGKLRMLAFRMELFTWSCAVHSKADGSTTCQPICPFRAIGCGAPAAREVPAAHVVVEQRRKLKGGEEMLEEEEEFDEEEEEEFEDEEDDLIEDMVLVDNEPNDGGTDDDGQGGDDGGKMGSQNGLVPDDHSKADDGQVGDDGGNMDGEDGLVPGNIDGEDGLVPHDADKVDDAQGGDDGGGTEGGGGLVPGGDSGEGDGRGGDKSGGTGGEDGAVPLDTIREEAAKCMTNPTDPKNTKKARCVCDIANGAGLSASDLSERCGTLGSLGLRRWACIVVRTGTNSRCQPMFHWHSGKKAGEEEPPAVDVIVEEKALDEQNGLDDLLEEDLEEDEEEVIEEPTPKCSSLSKTIKPRTLATQAQLRAWCGGSHCLGRLKMAKQAVCKLADGQVVGPALGGLVQDAKQDSFDCYINCVPEGTARAGAGSLTADCEYSLGPWGACLGDCGVGIQKQTMNVITLPDLGGKPCPAPPERPCNLQECPVACAGFWSEYGGCGHCAQREEYAFLTITQHPQFGGAPCPVEQQVSRPCDTQGCPVNCAGIWSAWSECEYCAKGADQHRSYLITQHPQFGGAPCPEETQEILPCPKDKGCSKRKGWRKGWRKAWRRVSGRR